MTEALDDIGPGLLVPVGDQDPGTALVRIVQAELEAAASYAEAARAVSTRRVYAQDWRVFSTWCAVRALAPMPADARVVAVFLASEAARGCAPMSIGRRLAAIGYAHRQQGMQPPQQREGATAIVQVMAGIRRSHGKPPARKHAADSDVLHDILRAIYGDDIRSVRDRALLPSAWPRLPTRRAGGASAGTDQPRAARPAGAVRVHQGGSGRRWPGDRYPDGRRIRPVQLLEEWLAQARIVERFVFRRLQAGAATEQPMSDRAVARVVQARVMAAGYDPARFAGHSLRAGFITSGARAGASIFKLKEVSRHKSTDVLASYVRDAQIFEGHAGDGFL